MTTWANNTTRADTMNGKYKYFERTRFHATTPPFARHPIDEKRKGSSRSLSSSSRIRVNDSWESIYLRIRCFFCGLCDIITEKENLDKIMIFVISRIVHMSQKDRLKTRDTYRTEYSAYIFFTTRLTFPSGWEKNVRHSVYGCSIAI